MSVSTCSVNDTIEKIDAFISSGRLKHPLLRRIAEEILTLLNDVAWGRAGDQHIPTMESLVQRLLNSLDVSSREAGGFLQAALIEHSEEFLSHIETRNCATGECLSLAPAPCQMTCPAGLDIPTYVALIGQGRDAEAVDVIRKDCPFPWVCGLVCTRPCELMCVRGRIDTPIAIKSLKGFAAERAMSEGNYRNPEKQPDKNKKVCVIGAGPGGMSAAYYLALKGYGVRIIEKQAVAGGMLLLGIPRYRLPREIIDREVSLLKELGIEFRFNTSFGENVTLEELKVEGFDAFFFAIGAQKSFMLGIPGEAECPQVFDAIDFLRRVALGDRQVPGNRVIVIGGGNVAIDAARTCLRLGCREVTIAYRRTRLEMPADHEEVGQAIEEGVRLEFLTVPTEVAHRADSLEGLHCLRAKLVTLDGHDRQYPKPIEGSDFFMAADAVICAIGQKVDTACMESVAALEWTRRSTINVKTATMETSVEGVFAAGDAVSGPATVIEAIGGGKRAAESIDRYLSAIPQPKTPPVPVRRGRIEWLEVPASTKMTLMRPQMPLLSIDRRRTSFEHVELGYAEKEARQEACRCLRCDICLRCGKCVEICRDKMEVDALQMGYFDFDHPVTTDFRVTAEKCIACGACAASCPTGAMKMEDQGDERILSLCGTILNRQKLVYCENCNAVLGPEKFLDFVRQRTESVARIKSGRKLCEVCTRKSTAGYGFEYAPVKFEKV